MKTVLNTPATKGTQGYLYHKTYLSNVTNIKKIVIDKNHAEKGGI